MNTPNLTPPQPHPAPPEPSPSRPLSRTIPRLELLSVFAATLLASTLAILWSYKNHAFLLYGDAEAHIHIARRLFDSHRPGLTQLGSVWLPLSHLILVPFVAINPWWRSGFAPVIPSAACYLLACLGFYFLARKWVSAPAASIGLALFAANPNLLYLQTTAMTEPLFLCELIWSVLLLVNWYESLDTPDPTRTNRLQWTTIAVLVAAVYTRYDGWILAFLAWIAMAVCLYRRNRLFRKSFLLASIVLALAPISWFLYNAITFGDWLEFQRGPYSARAIELRTASTATDPHPGWHNPWVALVYFLKCAEMDIAALRCGEFIALTAALGTVLSLMSSSTRREGAPPLSRSSRLAWNSQIPSRSVLLWTLFLWLPVPFYAYSVSYGSVPIFLPVWKPFSYYNTRYGMELLPALAFFTTFAIEAALLQLSVKYPRSSNLVRPAFLTTLAILLAANFAAMLHQKPIVYEEAKRNTAARGYFNSVIPPVLAKLHAQVPQAVILTDTSTYASIIPHAGLTYRQTINESDKEFYWAALGAPAAHAGIIIASANSEIAKAVQAHPEHLRLYQTFHSPNQGWDQADISIYITDTFPYSPLTDRPVPNPPLPER